MKTLLLVLATMVLGFELPPPVINDSEIIIYDTIKAPIVPEGAYGEIGFFESSLEILVYTKDGDSGLINERSDNSYTDFIMSDTISSEDTIPIVLKYKFKSPLSVTFNVPISECAYLIINRRITTYSERICVFIGDVRICGAWDKKRVIKNLSYDTLFLNERMPVESSVRTQSLVSIAPNPAPSTLITNPTSAPASVAFYTIDGRVVDRLTVAPGARATWKGKVGRYLVTVNGKGGRLLTINR